jgi:bile acid:Na+ symporter, BASS family
VHRTYCGLCSVGLVPLAAQVLSEYLGHHYAVAPVAIARVIGTTVLAPLAVGVVIRLAAPRVAETLANPVAFAAKVIMSLAALALLIVAAPALWCETGYSAGPRQRDAAGSAC